MNQYRFLEITTQYEPYLRGFYKTHKEIENLSYEELFLMFTEDGFAESDFMHRNLRELGIESKLIFCNNRNLQDKWDSEHGSVSYFDILLKQIKEFSPDILLISDMSGFTKEETNIIKTSVNSIKKLVGFHFAALDDRFMQNVPLYDQIYTGSKSFVDMMQDYGIPAYLLRHAFEPGILDKLVDSEKENKICFSGSVYLNENIHNNRLDMLNQFIESNISFDFYGDIHGNIQFDDSKTENQKRINIIKKIETYRKPSLYGIAYYNILSHYNICLNRHVPVIGNGAGNMRMFEVTGIGSCLFTDYRSENGELFDEDNEIVVYKSLDDMVEKAKWLLENPKKAREIALAGQKKTLKKYTYKNKAEQLNEYIQELLK